MEARQAGLTLVELMVVVAVMAVIAAVAYPIYTSQVQKSRRSDAMVALETIAMAEERYYTIAGEYGPLASLQISADLLSGDSEQGYYDITVSVTGADDEQFTVRAEPKSSGPQAQDGDCTWFELDQLGDRTASDAGSTKCWGK